MFILKTRMLVKQLFGRVSEAQLNTQEMYQLMYQWRDKPLYVRAASTRLLALTDRFNKVAARYNEISEAGEQVHELLSLNYHLLLNIPLPDSSDEDSGLEEDEGEGEAEGDELDEEEEDQGPVPDGDEEDEEIEEGPAVFRKRRHRRRIKDEDLLGLDERVLREEPQPKPVLLEPVPEEVVESKPKKVKKKAKEKKKSKKKDKKGKKKEQMEDVAEPIPQPEPEWVKESRDKEGKWREYVDFIDQVVIGGILSTISSSVGYLLDETDESQKHPFPLFRVDLELRDPDIIFDPSLDAGVGGFPDKIEGILREMYAVGKLVRRVAPHKEVPDYQLEAEGCVDLADMREEILDRMRKVIGEARTFGQSLMQYSHIWMTNQHDTLRAFLRYVPTVFTRTIHFTMTHYKKESIKKTPLRC